MVGADSPYAIERHYLRHLRDTKLIAKVELFAIQNLFLQYYHKNLFNKIIFRLGYKRIFKKINEQLLLKVSVFKPDVVLVFKGMEVLPSTIKKIRSFGIKIANYNPDSPFIFSGRGSGNSNVKNSIGLYDLHFTYSKEIKEELHQRLPDIPVEILPFGFELSDELYGRLVIQEEIIRPCFIGNADKSRASFISALANKGISIDVFGLYWNKFANHKNIHCHPARYNDDFWMTLRKYRVQLNLMRPHNENSHNMRSFEVPAVGGIQLAPDNEEHRSFFEDGKEIFLFNNVDECSEQIRYLLSLSATDADAIRSAARKRSLESGYSYKDRAEFVADNLSKFLV